MASTKTRIRKGQDNGTRESVRLFVEPLNYVSFSLGNLLSLFFQGQFRGIKSSLQLISTRSFCFGIFASFLASLEFLFELLGVLLRDAQRI